MLTTFRCFPNYYYYYYYYYYYSSYGFELDRTPCKNCEHLQFGSDSYWECAVKHDTNPENHQAGSCKMGPPSDPLAVVDNELRVKGIQGVRVADTSIMPQVTSGNTNAPAIMIGERAADFIKKSWNLKPSKCDFPHHYDHHHGPYPNHDHNHDQDHYHHHYDHNHYHHHHHHQPQQKVQRSKLAAAD